MLRDDKNKQGILQVHEVQDICAPCVVIGIFWEKREASRVRVLVNIHRGVNSTHEWCTMT